MGRLYVIEVDQGGAAGLAVRAESAGASTLGDVHAWIARAFGLDPAADYHFVRAGRRAVAANVFAGPGDAGPLSAEEARLDDLAWVAGRSMRHVSADRTERDRRVRVLEVREEPGGPGHRRGLRELERREISAPEGPQESEARELAASAGILAERWRAVSEAIAEAVEEDRADLPRPTPQLTDESLRQARRVHAFVAGSRERQLDLERRGDVDQFDWTVGLAWYLLDAGRAEEACEALELARPWMQPSAWRGDRVQLQLDLQRRSEAARLAEEWRAQEPLNPWSHLAAAGVAAANEDEDARGEHLRRALDCCGDDLEAEVNVLAPWIEWLSARGRADEAAAAERRWERARQVLDRIEQEEEEFVEFEEPAQSERFGRNEPCPCGSGKKFKRCHGAGRKDPLTDRECVDALLEAIARVGNDARIHASWNAWVPRFAGAEFEGFDSGALLPLLPSDGLDEAFVFWALLDFDVGEGRSVADLALRRELKGLDERRAALFESIRGSVPLVWRVEAAVHPADPVVVRVRDALDTSSDALDVRLPGDESSAELAEVGRLFVARVWGTDGAWVCGPGVVAVDPAAAETYLARVRAAFEERMRESPQATRALLAKRHAHLVYRVLIDTLHELEARAQ